MNEAALRDLIARVQAGTLSVDGAVGALRELPFSDLGYARVDHHRALRQGVPEVVFGQGKTAEEISGVVASLRSAGHSVLVTRVDAETAALVREQHPELEFHLRARCLALRAQTPVPRREGEVLVVTAGTSDGPVAEEAVLTLELAGQRVRRLTDVGVAGIHRLLAELPSLGRARAVICIAGMEGALPSVVGGLVACPVVAVPTSIGYGAAANGWAALLGMLTSCAAGVTVVNIDNGFGAAMAILRMAVTSERGNSDGR